MSTYSLNFYEYLKCASYPSLSPVTVTTQIGEKEYRGYLIPQGQDMRLMISIVVTANTDGASRKHFLRETLTFHSVHKFPRTL